MKKLLAESYQGMSDAEINRMIGKLTDIFVRVSRSSSVSSLEMLWARL